MVVSMAAQAERGWCVEGGAWEARAPPLCDEVRGGTLPPSVSPARMARMSLGCFPDTNFDYAQPVQTLLSNDG